MDLVGAFYSDHSKTERITYSSEVRNAVLIKRKSHLVSYVLNLYWTFVCHMLTRSKSRPVQISHCWWRSPVMPWLSGLAIELIPFVSYTTVMHYCDCHPPTQRAVYVHVLPGRPLDNYIFIYWPWYTIRHLHLTVCKFCNVDLYCASLHLQNMLKCIQLGIMVCWKNSWVFQIPTILKLSGKCTYW